MRKKKILIIDNVFAPSKKNKILNGVQKFSKAQRDVLSDNYEVHYVTMKGSDKQFPNQYILSTIQNVNATTEEKLQITKEIKSEIQEIIHKIKPFYVLDNSCKHLSTLYESYNVGVVFEHYYSPSMPLTPKAKEKFEKHGVYWCGVSNWQNNMFRNYFNGITSVHLVDKNEVVSAKNYGVFVGRWDRGKTPYIIMKIFAKKIKDTHLHIFTTINHSYFSKEDQKIIDDLSKCENITFHFDAPRKKILKYLSEAAFVLGGGKESTGIVSLEGASYGVPYIVRGSGSVAEQEHMLPFSMEFLDIKNGDIPQQLVNAVDKFKNYTLKDRKKIANYAYKEYNRSMFKDRQLDLLERALKNKIGKINYIEKSLYEIQS